MALASCLLLSNIAKAQGSDSSQLGVYGRLETFCGNGEIPRDIDSIPKFGCFYLSPGHSAIGTFSNHRVEVSVDVAGREMFDVDDILVANARKPQRTASGTNLPYVYARSVAGFSFCENATGPSCPSSITVLLRTGDKTVLFMVGECFPPTYHVCVDTQENWDYEVSHPNHLNSIR